MHDMVAYGCAVYLHQKRDCCIISSRGSFLHSSSHYLFGGEFFLFGLWVFWEALRNKSVHAGNSRSAERSLERDVLDSCLFLHEGKEVGCFLVDGGEVGVSALTGKDEGLLVALDHCGVELGVSEAGSWADDAAHAIGVCLQSIQRDEVALGNEEQSVGGGFEVVDELEVRDLQGSPQSLSCQEAPLLHVGQLDSIIEDRSSHAHYCHLGICWCSCKKIFNGQLELIVPLHFQVVFLEGFDG